MKKTTSISHLSFNFTKKSPLFFSEVSIDLGQSGHVDFIRGRNGAGKSTLFRIMNGDIAYNEFITGTINVGGVTIDFSDTNQREQLPLHVRQVPQKFDLMLADQFTFKENLELANLPRRPLLAATPGHRPLPDLVSRFGIDFSTPVHRLSGGQRQVLAILMALQKPTNLLLLDEPTAALDDKNAQMVITFLNELVKEHPHLHVLIICHDKEIVDRYARGHYFEIEVENNQRTIKKVSLT